MNKLVICYIRRLTGWERDYVQEMTGNSYYKWVTEGETIWRHGDETITVPKGFLTDGSSGGPDYSDAWLVHDWLYRTHKIEDRSCTRQEADKIMIDILKYQRHFFYAWVAKVSFKLNLFGVFNRSWNHSGDQGPHFL